MIDPKDYDLPGGFRHWVGDPAEDHVGPFFFRLNDGKVETVFRVGEYHCNAYGITHGGVLLAFADYTVSGVAIGESNESYATVSLNTEFVFSSKKGDLVRGYGELIRRTGSLVFARTVLNVEGRTVLTASAVIKKIHLQS